MATMVTTMQANRPLTERDGQAFQAAQEKLIGDAVSDLRVLLSAAEPQMLALVCEVHDRDRLQAAVCSPEMRKFMAAKGLQLGQAVDYLEA